MHGVNVCIMFDTKQKAKHQRCLGMKPSNFLGLTCKHVLTRVCPYPTSHFVARFNMLRKYKWAENTHWPV